MHAYRPLLYLGKGTHLQQADCMPERLIKAMWGAGGAWAAICVG